MSDPYAQPSSNPPPHEPVDGRPGGSPVPGSAYPQYTGYPSAPEFPRPPASTNGFAVAALVFGILGGLLGFVFGIVALVQIRRTGQKGTGLAVTGLVLSALWLLAAIGVGVALLVAGSADRDTGGEITEGGSVSAMSLQVGDCLNGLEEEGNVRSLPAVPCAEPHEGEVYATFDLPEGDYPGDTAIVEQAETGCDERMSAVAPDAYENESVGLYYLYPLELSWPDDREVVCIAISMSGTTTGSILD